MRAFMLMMCLAVLGTACSAPVPRSEAGPEDIPYMEYDADTPQSDAVCMSMDSLDALIEVANRPAPTCEYPQPEIIVVPTECPDITVTCEIEIVEVPVPAECPEPEVCEPEVIEVAVLPPSFRMWDTPFVIDPSDHPDYSYQLMGFVLAGGNRPHDLTHIEITLGKFGYVDDGGPVYGDWYWEEPCNVVQCESLQLFRLNGGWSEPIIETFETERRSDALLSPDDWAGHELLTNGEETVAMFGRVRADAPPGRYRFILREAIVAHEGDPSLIQGTPAYGSEFTVAEDVPEPDDAVPPRFINVSSPVPLNPRGAQRVLEFRRCAGSQPLTMVELQFVLNEYTEDAGVSAWRTRSPCEVLDCDTTDAMWHVEDGSDDTVVTPLALRTDTSVTLTTPFGWEGTVIPSERCAYFSIATKIRTETPTGRYSVSTQFLAERIGGEEDVSLTAPLLRGSEIIVLE